MDVAAFLVFLLLMRTLRVICEMAARPRLPPLHQALDFDSQPGKTRRYHRFSEAGFVKRVCLSRFVR